MEAALSAVLALGTVALVAVLVFAEWRGAAPLRIASKTGASLGFVAFALASGAGAAGVAGMWTIAALALCVVGDLCLLSKARAPFLAGLVAFLLGHVCFTIAFTALSPSLLAIGLAAVPLAATAAVVWRWLGPHAGSLAKPVLAYIAVISTMVAVAVGVAMGDPTPGRLGLLGAAVAFFLSDLCVARDRFVAPGPDNKTIGLPLYYGAQLAFGAAILPAVTSA